MSIGNESIDADHKKILEIVNAVEIYNVGAHLPMLQQIFHFFGNLTGKHFKEEEKLMSEISYPGSEIHKKQHHLIINKFNNIFENFSSANTKEQKHHYLLQFRDFLNSYFVDHIIKEDLRIKPYLRSAGTTSLHNLNSYKDTAPKRPKDFEYVLPPDLAHMMQRLDYVIAPMPEPRAGFSDFNALCEAAIAYRIDRVLVFFHRHNPALQRELPPLFIHSPEFAVKYHTAVHHFIFPVIRATRQIQTLSANLPVAEINAGNFWDHLTPPLLKTILAAWNNAWDALKLVSVTKADGTKVMQVMPQTKELREMLAPSRAGAYDLPRVGNREIDTFKSLLDTLNDWWEPLNRSWQILHDIYEQEKDPRIFQSRAREGALRDNMLNAFEKLPGAWGDLIALTCHRIFPRVSTQFLEKFTTNYGTTDEARDLYLPYTMYYLRQARQRPDIVLRELREEEQYQAQAKQLRDYLTGRSEDD